MFLKRKVRSTVAVICVAATLIVNTTSAIAAPFGYNGADAIRIKALGEYFSSSVNILAMTKNSGANVENTSSKEVTVEETVNFNTVKRLNADLAAGETVTVREGVTGTKKVTYKVNYENGKEISREAIAEIVTTAPIDKIVEYGNKTAEEELPTVSTEKGVLKYKRVITCEATAYDLSAEENGGYAGQTATGVPLDRGVIAVDPRVIPLGSRVYIEALDGSWTYGYAVAADTGGAIKGNRVDLCYRTQYECVQFGRRQCRVYILD